MAASTRTVAPASKPALDTASVRKLYQDGDFEQAIGILAAALKEGKVNDHPDSIFVFKHLGVMYAANDATRERGKYYMLQLLLIEPTARIMDMYASDMIYMIFKNIQEELASTQLKYNRAEGHVSGNAAVSGNGAIDPKPPADKPPADRPKSGDKKTHYWVGVTGVLVVLTGVGIAAYFLSEPKSASTKTLQVD